MFAADDLHTYATGEDALANIRSQLARDIARKQNSKLISQIWGLLSAEGAPLNETHVCDVSTCTGDVQFGNTLNPATITGAKYKLSEHAGTLTRLAVHPDTAAWLEAAGMLTVTNITDTRGCFIYLGLRWYRLVLNRSPHLRRLAGDCGRNVACCLQP